MDVTVTARSELGATVVTVSGEIDVYTSPQLRERLTEVIDTGATRLIVDLEGVEFLDSTGLGVLVAARNRVSGSEGAVLLVCSQERLLKLFRITGLDAVFEIHPSMSEATAAS